MAYSPVGQDEKSPNSPSQQAATLTKVLTTSSFSRYKQRLLRYALALISAVVLFKITTSSSRSSGQLQVQYAFKANTPAALPQIDRREAVKREFLHAWYGYRDHAWMADALMPLTGGRQEKFCGWSATLVDSLDTLWIMGLTDEFNEAVEAVVSIDFTEISRTSILAGNDHLLYHGIPAHRVPKPLGCTLNLFESTIRYLGGMLAAYDLSGDERLKLKVVELGNMLHKAWRTQNGLPCSYCDPVRMVSNEVLEASSDVPLADIGSFYLELARLFQVTGNLAYLDTLNSMTEIFYRAQNQSAVAGLWPERVDANAWSPKSDKFKTNEHVYSLGALSDSAYEYLVKSHQMLGGVASVYADMWDLASAAIRKYMLFHASIPQYNASDVLFSGIVYSEEENVFLEPRTQHLACFAGGMFALAGKLFDRPEDLKTGEALTEGCVWAYETGPLGLMPETFSLVLCPNVHEQCDFNQSLWTQIRRHPEELPEICGVNVNCEWSVNFPDGYLASIDTQYPLRPEAIESVFIMYRLTGDEKWRDKGWRMFENIIKHTRTDYGHASLKTVMEMSSQTKYVNGKAVSAKASQQKDEMESFWLAETLKYFYLLFSETSLISLDEWVLNTEAHPLRLQPRSMATKVHKI